MSYLRYPGAMLSILLMPLIMTATLAQSGVEKTERMERFEKDGIVIELKPLALEMDGYRNFELRIMNLTEAPRSVHGRFRLLSRSGQEAGSCTLFVELAPGESKTRTKACKETALSRSYRFEIVRVYSFVLDQE